MIRRGAPLLGLLALVLLGVRAEAGPTSRYAPVPPGIRAALVSERDRTLGEMALTSLRRMARDERETARAQLLLLGDAGLRLVAEALAGGAAPHALRDLLQVVADSEHAEADVLLERAAGEAPPGLRMIAAEGLGRGRSPRAVEALVRLAQDPVPAVRIAALRSLFALESEAAVAARRKLPPDRESTLLVARLRWHRRCEDDGAGLLEIARTAWREGAAALRLAAADLLALPRLAAPDALLLDVIGELGSNALGQALVRFARGRPLHGYDDVACRRIAIEAALTLLERADLDPETRARAIDRAVGWVAQPVEMDPRGSEPIPEFHLRRRLPDLGVELLAPVLARLKAHSFAEPRAGTILLRELGAEVALPVLRDLLASPVADPAHASRADLERRYYLRSAASGAIQELGRIDDEALARAVIEGPEAQAIKIDVVRALVRDPGPWVVALLAEVAAGENRELRSHALDILERRPEPAARAVLVADLFRHAQRPDDRLQVLVARADEEALDTLARALADERAVVRRAGLGRFHKNKNPALMRKRGRALLDAFEPDLTSPLDTQKYLEALLHVAPMKAVAFVRERWAQLPTRSARMRLLRMLQDVRGRPARRAAVDLALLHAGADAPTPMLASVGAVLEDTWSYRRDEVTAFWRRLLASESRTLRWQAVDALDHPRSADMSDLLLPLLALALERTALGDESLRVDEQAFARELITALAHQPIAKVEPVLIDVALEPMNEVQTRVLASQALMKRLSDAGRDRLMTWLGVTAPAGGGAHGRLVSEHDDSSLLLNVAAAVGEGAAPAVAGSLRDRLAEDLFAFYTPERMARLDRESFKSIDDKAPVARTMALARGVAHTHHEPTVVALLDIVFDLRFARYARIAVKREAETLVTAGADLAARLPSPIARLGHRDGNHPALGVMPAALSNVLSQVKVLDDERLAVALERVLSAARRDGRLAHFPALYLTRLLQVLRDKPTGAKPMSVEVVVGYRDALGSRDSAIDYYDAMDRVTELTLAGRFAEAVDVQHRAVRVVARGGHGDRNRWLWRYERARLDAVRGSAFAAQGLTDQAGDAYRRAVLRGPTDPNVLNTVAWQRALAGFRVDFAEADARRATVLEARVENRPGVAAADTLAYVLLKRGKAAEGWAVLDPHVRGRGMRDGDMQGLIYWHMAQLDAETGQFGDALRMLIEALAWDRTLAAKLDSDPHLAFVREEGHKARLLDAAAALRRERQLE